MLFGLDFDFNFLLFDSTTYFVSVRIEVGLEIYFPIFFPIVQIEYNVPNPRRNTHTIAWLMTIHTDRYNFGHLLELYCNH